MKKITYIIIILFTFSVLALPAQRESGFKTEKKKVFKKDGFRKKSGGPDKAGPPGPGGGGGGNPVPISGGALLLAGGVLLYTIYRTKKKDA